MSRKKYIYRTDTGEYFEQMSDGVPVWTDEFSNARFYGSVNKADEDYETLKELGFSVGVGG